ncbi:MAG TPA: dienelactone hydrolase family protein, partial [Ramlibacter sp.]|nr:dienelactone hydrolase family protein [Ramlibacter sp.]
MGEWIQLQASDGFRAKAWQVPAKGRARGGLVLVQEIFGVNGHIRDLARRLAEEGFDVVAPSLFDRAMPQVELGYGREGIERGVSLMQQASLDAAMVDIAAAQDALDPGRPRAVMGFCWGGLVSWLAACRVPGLAAAVSYYPGGISQFAH